MIDVKMLAIVIVVVTAVVAVGYYLHTAPAQGPVQEVDGIPVFKESCYHRIEIPEVGQVGVLLLDSDFNIQTNPVWAGELLVKHDIETHDMFIAVTFVVDEDYCYVFREKMTVKPINFEIIYADFDEKFISLEEFIKNKKYENEYIKMMIEDLKKTNGDICMLGIMFKPTNTETGQEFRSGDIIKFKILWNGQELFRVEAPISIRFD